METRVIASAAAMLSDVERAEREALMLNLLSFIAPRRVIVRGTVEEQPPRQGSHARQSDDSSLLMTRSRRGSAGGASQLVTGPTRTGRSVAGSRSEKSEGVAA